MPQPFLWDPPGLAFDMPGVTWDGAAPDPTPIMANDNRISTEITPQKKAAIVAAIQALKTELQGVIINLNVEERQSLPKIGDKTLAFDEKCKAYMAQRPELVPGFVVMAEVNKDRALVADLMPCLQELAPICEGLQDTISVAYTDIYTADLAFHANVRQAAKRGVSGADTIYDDLKERFPGRPPAGPNGGNGGGAGAPNP
jgi:hypothetical protein